MLVWNETNEWNDSKFFLFVGMCVRVCVCVCVCVYMCVQSLWWKQHFQVGVVNYV